MKKLLLLLTVFLTGCGGGYGITYNTVPEGASVICDGVHKGYSPIRLTYDVDKEFNTKPCYAQWSSGVKKNYSDSWDTRDWPDGVMQTLQRPSGGDYSKDAEFALKVQEMRQQQQSAQNSADAISSIGTAINLMNIQNNIPKFQPSPPVPITFGPPSPWWSY